MTPLQMIAEWRRGCSCSCIEHPEECQLCTRSLIDALDKKLAEMKPIEGRDISNLKEISLFFHCRLCVEEYAKRVPGSIGISRRDWAEIEVGFTELGIQVWCKRHECNIAHVDFEGVSHPANETRMEP